MGSNEERARIARREGKSIMLSVRIKRIILSAIGLVIAVSTILGVSAIPAFAVTSAAGTAHSSYQQMAFLPQSGQMYMNDRPGDYCRKGTEQCFSCVYGYAVCTCARDFNFKTNPKTIPVPIPGPGGGIWQVPGTSQTADIPVYQFYGKACRK